MMQFLAELPFAPVKFHMVIEPFSFFVENNFFKVTHGADIFL